MTRVIEGTRTASLGVVPSLDSVPPLDSVPALTAALAQTSTLGEAIPYTPIALVAAVVSIGFALVMWRARRAPGAPALLALALGAAWWSFTYGLEQSVATLGAKLLLGRLSYLGIVAVPVAWFAFAMAYTGRGDRLTRRTLALLSAPALVAAILPWTSGSNDLFWATTTLERGGTGVLLALEYGPAFWLWSAYAYLLLAGGTVLLLWSVPSNVRLFRVQTALLVGGVAAPWLANATYLLRLSPGALDFTPIAFVVSAVALGGGLQRYRFLDVHPAARAVARDELVEGMAEPVVVCNGDGLVVDLNASARTVLDIAAPDPIGTSIESVAPELADAVADIGTEDRTALFTTGDPARHYEIQVTALSGNRRGHVGQLLTLRDVTERRRRELRLAVLNRVLRHDLRNDLSVVAGYAQLLREVADAEEYATIIAERTNGALDLVRTVGDVEQTLEEGVPTRSEIDLVRVVDEQVAAARRSHPEATLVTDLPTVERVHATDLVTSVVDNLVENAIEHNDTDDPTVRVSLARVRVDGRQYVELRVADDGPGIPPCDRRVLVGDEGATLEDASGLGLWLVNWIVTESRGEVRYEENEPRGSVVVVRLPAVDPDADDDSGDGPTADPDRVARRIPLERPTRDRSGASIDTASRRWSTTGSR